MVMAQTASGEQLMRIIRSFQNNNQVYIANHMEVLLVIGLFSILIIGLLLRYFLAPQPKTAKHNLTAIRKSPEQMREWVRIPVDLEFQFTKLHADYTEFELYTAKMIDLSAGGLLFETDECYEVEEQLGVILELPPAYRFNLTASIVRIIENHSAEGPRFQIGVKFEDISKHERELLVNWVFAQQRQEIEAELTSGEHRCYMCGELLPDGNKGKQAVCVKCRKAYGIGQEYST